LGVVDRVFQGPAKIALSMPSARRLALLALLTAVYYAAGRFGLSLAFVNQSASAVWPPTGIAIAACLLAGPGVWPAVLLGAFLVNLSSTSAVLPSLLIACGNTAEMLLAAWLVRRFAGGAGIFRTTTGILIYVVAAGVAAAIAATVGLAALLLGDLAGPSTPAMVWLTWWTGDLAGALIVTPAIVTWADLRWNPWPWRRTRTRLLEAALLLVTLVAAGYWVFGPTPFGIRGYPLMFVVLPIQLWAAVRFGLRGATTAVLVTSAIAITGTLEGFGPFARGTPNESLLLLQAYLSVKMVVMVSLAAEVAGRRAVEQEIRQLNADLSRRVDARAEELRRLHGRLVEAQQVAHIGSWEWDVAANSIWWSDEMYGVYGLPVGSPVTYERYISMVHHEDRAMVQAIVSRSGDTGEPFTFEHRAVAPDGSVRILHSRGRVVRDEQGRAIRMLGVGYDITERKLAEEERLELVREQAARREAEEASRMKDHFLATLSHELRTPLNAIAGWAQMLKDHAPDEALRRRAVDAIHRNVTVQAQLVSDILDVAGIRSGTLSIEARPVTVNTIVAGALDMLRPIIEAKEIAVTARVPDNAAVMGDGQRLQQVFWNVLSNAAKFTPAGGHIVVSARAHPDADVIEVTVEDDGPGIAEDFLPHVFEQFRQADPSVTREHGGLGLGLAISHNLVQLHGGTMTAANRDQGGAVFTVRLPAAVVETSQGSSA
jgi:signal transduction histidine kinase/integral membrane sensor domain MASE1